MKHANHNEMFLLSLKSGKDMGVEKWIVQTEIEKSGKVMMICFYFEQLSLAFILQGSPPPPLSSIFDWIIMIYDVFKSKTMMERGQVRQKSMMGGGQVIVKGNWAKEIKINSELKVPFLEELLMCTTNTRLPSGRIGVHYMLADTILTSLFSVYCI